MSELGISDSVNNNNSMEDGPSDEQITMLMCMGFGDINDIQRALKLAKNDINEAVAILTGEDSRG